MKKKIMSQFTFTDDLEENKELIELRERVDHLNLSLKEEKKKSKIFETSFKNLSQKYCS